MSSALLVLGAQVVADGEGGGGPAVRVNVPWQVVAWGVVGILVLLAIGGVAFLILGRRPGRLPMWRQKRLAVEESLLGEGPRRALIRLRLQLDEGLGVAKAALAIDGADIGDLRLLVMRLEAAATRVGQQIDALLQNGADSLNRSVVDALRQRVREIESAADALAGAATATAAGSSAAEIEEITHGVRGQLELVDVRTDALRELSGLGADQRRPADRRESHG